MLTYRPIPVPCELKCSSSDLLDFQWRVDGISATFIIPGREDAVLQVSFAKPAIIRLVDEMPLSTEEDNLPNEGLVANHFAYRVEGSAFFLMQSDAWKLVHAPCTHYRFVTGWTCLDVIAGVEPQFAVVPR